MGGVRTALYNYLFAKKHGGDFILRVEDTDQTRLVNGAEAYIIDSLKWCGITPDEGQGFGGSFGPYRQSDRKPMYKAFAEQLVQSGHAYYAFDTPDDLEAVRELAKKAGTPNWQYNHVTRGSMKNSLTLPKADVAKRIAGGEAYVIRIKLPRNEEVKLNDLVRGWVTVNTNNMDDKVLFKSDGMPTYHLANIVDDYHMKITHVIRGEEWLPSAPLHVLLYRYLGWEEVMPRFAHLPLLLKPDGNGKLSKRDGDRLGFPVFPLEWHNVESGEVFSGYREKGYFPEAFVNMLAFLGWNPGTEKELFSLDELIESFSLDRVNKAGARYDHDKTRWFNQQYLRAKEASALAPLLLQEVEAAGLKASIEKCAKVAAIMKERAFFVKDMLSEGVYLFKAPTTFDAKTLTKKWNADAHQHVQNLFNLFNHLNTFDAPSLESTFKAYLAEKEVGFGKVGPGFRLAVTGQGMGPSMFEICNILGKKETLTRMKHALDKLPVNG